MPIDRRTLIASTIGAGLATAAHAGPRPADRESAPGAGRASASEMGLEPGAGRDQAPALQRLIDEAASRGAPLYLPPGSFRSGPLQLRQGSRLIGAAGMTTLVFAGGGDFISADAAGGVAIEGLALDAGYKRLGPAGAALALSGCRGLRLRALEVLRSAGNGIALQGSSGSVSDCTVTGAMEAGIRSLDAAGLEIRHNLVADGANNGIQVWRSEAGEDGSVVAGNRIERIRADAGGSGQNGNGVNVFRAGNVLVEGNRISDCAYSAVRGNAASDIQMVANSCTRLGEVALYAEFGFEGALITANLVDQAATGITVTNFNDGGRLAVVQGNLVRNLFRREHEPVDKRGHGITVEADAAVTGNTIESAATAGIVIGWGAYLRDVVATGNLIRKSRVGILVSRATGAGACLLASNMISGAGDGAIRAMDDAGEPYGADLAQSRSAEAKLSLSGNIAV